MNARRLSRLTPTSRLLILLAPVLVQGVLSDFVFLDKQFLEFVDDEKDSRHPLFATAVAIRASSAVAAAFEGAGRVSARRKRSSFRAESADRSRSLNRAARIASFTVEAINFSLAAAARSSVS